MDRRTFIAALGATTGLAADTVLAQGAKPSGAHAGHPDVKVPARPETLDAILASTGKCQTTGSVCLSHCSYYVLTGDERMADCQRAVMNMLAVTDAMQRVAGYNTADPKHLQSLAKTCADYCRACAKACEPHADHHPECKACMDACRECARSCDAYVAAS